MSAAGLGEGARWCTVLEISSAELGDGGRCNIGRKRRG